MVRSKLDPTHIAQLTYDENSEAMKVKMTDSEMSIELDANDGDSVRTEPTKLTASAIDCTADDNGTDVIPALDCQNMREVHVSVDGSGEAQIYVSPNDSGNFFYYIGNNLGGVHQICARRIKVVSVDVIGNVHLVGRS